MPSASIADDIVLQCNDDARSRARDSARSDLINSFSRFMRVNGRRFERTHDRQVAGP